MSDIRLKRTVNEYGEGYVIFHNGLLDVKFILTDFEFEMLVKEYEQSKEFQKAKIKIDGINNEIHA